MPDSIPLTPCRIDFDSPEFREILEWTFDDSYVGRLLRDDIPNRMQFGNCRTWTYRDPDGRETLGLAPSMCARNTASIRQVILIPTSRYWQ